MSETHIKQWQKMIGVTIDGDFGPETFSKSESIYKKAYPSDNVDNTPTGDDLIKLAETRIGERYVYGANVDLDDPNWHGPWDCAEYCSWVVKQKTGKTYGCVDNFAIDPDPYTGGWRKDILNGTVIGIPVAEAAKTRGALLLRYRPNGKHIVFSDGNGKTTEAKGSAYGVCKGTVGNLSSWDYGIILKEIKYN